MTLVCPFETLGQTPEKYNGKGEEFQRNYWVASIITRRQSFSCTFMLIITLDATNVYVDHNRPLPLILLKSIQRCQFG